MCHSCDIFFVEWLFAGQAVWQISAKVVFSADEAVRRSKDGDKVILVRIETSPDDIHGLHAAEGVLTTRGGESVPFWRCTTDGKENNSP